MAKSILLPLCCVFIVQGLRAQDYRNADTTVPQKLELRKPAIATTGTVGWVDYFAKKPDESDTAPSILYLGPPKEDSFDLNLPKLQASHLSLRAPMRRQQPLFRIGQ